MMRSKKVALVAHCLLNANARVEGIARYPGIHPVIAELARREYGVIQLPCPELTACGLDRSPATVEEYEREDFVSHCESLVASVCEQVDEYRLHGYEVGPVIGMESSPSCAVRLTTSGRSAEHTRIERPGVFMRLLMSALSDYGIEFVGIDHHEDEDGIARVRESLAREDVHERSAPS